MTPPVPPTPPARDRQRPFRRINLPDPHTPPRDGPGGASTPIDGRGYDCGCRAATDYDGKIGEEIGNEVADIVKLLTGLKAIDAAKDALAGFLGNIPIIGPAIKQGIQKFFDDIDPLKNLFKRLGRALDALLVDSLIRGVPSWVPVFRGRADEARLLEQEIEGRLVRSFQRYDSVPFTQWHAWYDWCFRVATLPGDAVFDRMIGRGNSGRTRNDDSLEQEASGKLTRYDRDTAIVQGADIDRTIDCDWDLGALGEPPGPMFTGPGATLPTDWMWPMTGSHFWASGRSVYDCGHATSDEKAGADVGLHLNKLNPCKAIATARLEGVKFDENPLAVPAVQFMFYASRTRARGHPKEDPSIDFRFKTAGNFRFPSLADADYEFLVDLPEAPERVGPFAIGATPTTLLNTVVAGRVLLHRFDVANFNAAFDFQSNGGVQPEIEPVRRSDGLAPTQVKLRFPLTRVTAPRTVNGEEVDGLNTYGVIVSLGWFDPGGALAATVHKVTVILDRIRVVDTHESGEPEFFVNLAVNGRWFQIEPDGAAVQRNRIIDLQGRTVNLFLAEADAVSVSVHGMEADGLHDIMKLPPDRRHPPVPDEALSAALKVLEENFLNDRMLRGPKLIKVSQPGSGQPPRQFQVPFVGRPVEWEKDVDQKLLPKGGQPVDPDAAKKADAHASIVTRAMFLRIAMQAFDANDVLGLIDPNVRLPDQKFGRVNDDADAPNPFKVADIIKEAGFGRFRSCRLSAYETDAIGRTANLAYDKAKLDYVLEYRVKVDRQ